MQYQEEIIDSLSRDKNDLQHQLQQAEEAAHASVKVAEENLNLVNEYKAKEKSEEERRINDISTKEQWEREKDEIIRNHDAEKTALTNELRLLRQSSNPSADQIFADLRRNELLLGSLEDQLVKSEMANDQLKVIFYSIFHGWWLRFSPRASRERGANESPLSINSF